MAFKFAKRELTKLRVGLFGPPGVGKTLGALMLAASMGEYEANRRGEKGQGKVLVVDCENGRAAAYVGHRELPSGFQFYYEKIKPPFHPKKYVKIIEQAAREGIDVIVIDGLSQAWAGRGGMLDMKDKSGDGNNFAAWRFISKEHALLVDALLQNDIHVIVTCRSKVEHVLEKDEKGRQQVAKKGLSPVFRDGLEYEFLLVFNIDDRHIASPSKDNTSLYDTPHGKVEEMIDLGYGKNLCAWLYESGPQPDGVDSDDEEEEIESEDSSDSFEEPVKAANSKPAKDESDDDLF